MRNTYAGLGVTTGWRKARASFANGNCVEVADWRKPSASTYNGNCVEAGGWRKPTASIGNGQCAEVSGGPAVAVRDTTDRDGTVLIFPARAWAEFTAGLRLDR